MRKNKFFLLFCLLWMTSLSFAQKTTLTFNVIAYIEQKTADYFGGKQAIQDSIAKQLDFVNANYNAQSGLNNYYNFQAVAFKYYNDNANDDSTIAYFQAPPETNYNYRIVYNTFPNVSSNNYNIAFNIDYQAVIFSYLESGAHNGSMFDRVMTQVLTHEMTHTRGPLDIYAGNLDANKNLVNPDLGWSNPTPSLMNSDYTNTNLDEYSLYIVNKTATVYGASTFTYAQREQITGETFPQTFKINVTNGSGVGISNAVVKLYGIVWFPNDPSKNFTIDSSNPTFTYNTDVNGMVILDGISNNPFGIGVPGAVHGPDYNTFFVTVTYNNQTRYDWIPYYEVSNAFIEGNTSYVKNISIGGANLPPTSVIGPSGPLISYDPMTTVFPVWAYDLDGSISSVKIYDNGSYIGDATFDDSRKIYWYYTPTLSVGKHVFTAVATDNSGASSTTQPMEVDVKPANVVKAAITYPADNASYTAPATVSISAYANEGGGTISKVEFYNGTSLLGTANGLPYSYVWNNVPAGTYSLTVKAYDGQSTPVVVTSSPVTIIVNPSNINGCDGIPVYSPYPSIYNTGDYVQYNGVKYQSQVDNLYNVTPGTAEYWWKTIGACGTSIAPTVSLTAPANNAVYNSIPASISISADASETGGSISKVEFYNGSTLLASSTTSPYSYNWTNVPAGTYTISAKAYDAGGSSTTSSSVTVKVNAAPTVHITSPLDNTNSFTAPASVNIITDASDSDGSVSNVEFFSGTTSLGIVTSSPFNYTWTNVAAGTYSLTAKATDNNGSVTTSSPISITVNVNNSGGCNGIAQYVENGGYVAGSEVQNGGGIYQCKPYPYSGWCNGAAWAYAPGTGTYWTDAWDKTGNCSAKMGTFSNSSVSSINALSVFPNPTNDLSQLKLNVSDVYGGDIEVSNSLGEVVYKSKLDGNLESVIDLKGVQNGIYIIKVSSAGSVWLEKLIKQ